MEGSGSRLATAGEDLKIWASPSFSLVHQVSFCIPPIFTHSPGQFLQNTVETELFQNWFTPSELFFFSVHTLLIVARLFKLLEPGHNLCGKRAQGEGADLAHLLQEGVIF